jgi:hypothetical protein
MTSYLVFNKRTGTQICETPEFDDALMMVQFDIANREIRQRHLLSDQVIDISSVRLPDDKRLKGQLILEPVVNTLPYDTAQPFNPRSNAL